MTTTTRTVPEITVIPTTPGNAIVMIGTTTYLFTDCTQTIQVQKCGVGGETYTVRLGTRGCYGCTCPAGRYRRVARCRHEAAADKFLDVTF